MIYLLPLLLLAADNGMKDLVNKTKTAALSTMYKEYPYTSLVPYTVDKNGRPIIFISDLAMHTKNLKKNEKCSLMATKINGKDVFNSARITFIGKMNKVPDKEVEKVNKIYLEKYPDSKELLEMEDFAFYRMEIDQVNYIGGFGDINWYNKTQYIELWK